MQNLVLNSLNSLKSLETHFKEKKPIQATFKVVLHFADASGRGPIAQSLRCTPCCPDHWSGLESTVPFHSIRTSHVTAPFVLLKIG
jgi:hypothetical protein